MHWADVIARDIMSKGSKHLISTGISPSGHIHVGSLREAITAKAVYRSLLDMNADVKLIYLVDDYDPLRKRYPFLPERYEKEIGRPLCRIPCPGDGCHESYGHHFIQPFLDAIADMGVRPKVYHTAKVYEEGGFAEVTDIAIREREKIAAILKEVTGRDVPAGFYPYSPLCSACGHFTDKITGYEHPYVHYKCHCGHEGKADIRKGEGKLPWRVEWAAKWKLFGVTCEPFGKDHAAAGGSYDSGVRLAREIFGIEPPFPVPYEFIQFKGKGQMHKSTGNVVTGTDALAITPAPVLAFSVMRYSPDRHIDYDPGLGILDTVDEYDKMEALYYEGGADEKEKDLLRAYELAQPECTRPKKPLQVPYRHLVHIVQTAPDLDGVLTMIKRTENLVSIDAEDRAVIEQRCACVRHWLDNFAPEEVKFSIASTMPQVELGDDEKRFLSALLPVLKDAEWNATALHDAVHGTATGLGVPAKVAFQSLYKILIGKKQGPRLGYFLSTMERSFVIGRVGEAL